MTIPHSMRHDERRQAALQRQELRAARTDAQQIALLTNRCGPHGAQREVARLRARLAAAQAQEKAAIDKAERERVARVVAQHNRQRNETLRSSEGR